MATFRFSELPGRAGPFATKRALAGVEAGLKALGGDVLTDPCRPDELATKNTTQPTYTCGCGGTTRMAVPYSTGKGSAQFATICAICDAAYMMPRLKDAPQ